MQRHSVTTDVLAAIFTLLFIFAAGLFCYGVS